jgi:hypothetical protein
MRSRSRHVTRTLPDPARVWKGPRAEICARSRIAWSVQLAASTDPLWTAVASARGRGRASRFLMYRASGRLLHGPPSFASREVSVERAQSICEPGRRTSRSAPRKSSQIFDQPGLLARQPWLVGIRPASFLGQDPAYVLVRPASGFTPSRARAIDLSHFRAGRPRNDGGRSRARLPRAPSASSMLRDGVFGSSHSGTADRAQ